MTEPTPGPAAPHPAPDPAADPSMEDILASIRRILNEEDAKPPEPTAPVPPPEDVLELDETMLVAEPEGAPNPQPALNPLAPVPPPPSMANTVTPVPLPPEPASTAERGLAVPFPVSPLVAPEAAASAAASVGALMRTLASERTAAVHRGGPTLEDLVREEMRPLLKDWLDSHLAPMVERLVRAEIERVMSRLS